MPKVIAAKDNQVFSYSEHFIEQFRGGDHAIPSPGIAPVLCGSKTVGSLVSFLPIRGIGQDQINGLVRQGLQANQTILIENGIKFHVSEPFPGLGAGTHTNIVPAIQPAYILFFS